MSRPVRFQDLDRSALAVLAREYLLAGQLMDRAGMPHVIGAYGREQMGQIAIDEWMGASPIYTRRMQRLLGFAGDDIETLFKGLQLDIGAPPEFMDFRLHVIDEHHGEFWLDHCGALMDVEPMGEDYVHTMCHTIEDPTFDATAMATNPRARIRPIHRPPRLPGDRHPHCHWTATIDPSAEPLPEPEPALHIARTLLARTPVATVEAVPDARSVDAPSTDAPDDGGWDDYTAPLDPDLRLEQFSRPALVGLVDEIAVQQHLLVMSFLLAIERRDDAEQAASIGYRQFAGIAGLTSSRLREAFGLDTSLAAVAQVLEWHPAFHPRPYVDVSIELEGSPDELTFRLHSCDAADEPERMNWISLLARGTPGADAAVDALVQGVDPHYRCEPAPRHNRDLGAWKVVRADEPAKESRDVALTRFSTGAEFRFTETPVQVGQPPHVGIQPERAMNET